MKFEQQAERHHRDQAGRGFFHGRVLSLFHRLIRENPDVQNSVDRAEASGLSFPDILAAVAPIIIHAFVAILAGNPLNWATLAAQVIAAIEALINPQPAPADDSVAA